MNLKFICSRILYEAGNSIYFAIFIRRQTSYFGADAILPFSVCGYNIFYRRFRTDLKYVKGFYISLHKQLLKNKYNQIILAYLSSVLKYLLIKVLILPSEISQKGLLLQYSLYVNLFLFRAKKSSSI